MVFRFGVALLGLWIACGISHAQSVVVPSRAIAMTMDLSAYKVVMTLGYRSAGDGGGALFRNRNAAITGTNLTGLGTSCLDGMWTGVKMVGGTGSGATGTLYVSGGVAVRFDITGANAQGDDYTVGDVLTASPNNIHCATSPQVTVSSVGSAPFIDTAITGTTVLATGSSCTNGTYYGLYPQAMVIGANVYGDGLQGNAVISGGQLTSFTGTTLGGGYKAGDVVSFVAPNGSPMIPGCAAQPTVRVTNVGSPLGSFQDLVGNTLQISRDNINVRAFGAVGDLVWLQAEADATDDGPAMRAALAFAAVGNGPADAHGHRGGFVQVPTGGYRVCGGLVQPAYVTFYGAGGGSTIQQCSSDPATACLLTQGDPLNHKGAFFANTWDLTLYGSATGTAAVVCSNNNQGGDALVRVSIYGNASARGCLKYTDGYGGQSMYGVHSVLCVPVAAAVAFDFSGNFGVSITGQTMISSVSTVGKGYRFGDGGNAYIGTGVHCEGAVTNCASIAGGGTSPPLVTIEGLLGPATTNLINIEAGTPAGYVTVTNVRVNAPCTVYREGSPGSCLKTGTQTGTVTY